MYSWLGRVSNTQPSYSNGPSFIPALESAKTEKITSGGNKSYQCFPLYEEAGSIYS